MRKAGEVPGGFQSALPAAPPRPARLTTEIPDCGEIALDRLGEVDHHVLNRVLRSGRPARTALGSGR
ncbi:hypothetical protein DI272_12475 [Streptomyces sp. Act143]|uniref:hypothetical protein n=1 Tax=Streptomyces sp. Act143 TaxID=2200760 RepID=UPI000D676B28|nr:hypothetical protein [Streptomyces sp. Act143]PWI14886.1 hypothetical protein DI272_12475 [Streptomyces sp. Act143]